VTDDLADLRAFLAVVDTGSIAAAARQLAEPITSLRRLVLALEGRLGVPLLTRDAGGATPTAAGRILAERGRSLIARYDALLEAARALE
jgi:molybdate transport repressor ModE-like protein